ncbi:MAG: aconitate hydratase [Candidatus Hodarchaeales archaeon]
MTPSQLNVTQKLIKTHLLEGKMVTGQEIALKIDQTLTQDATGTAVMLELEAMDLKQIKSELSVQYVDHNILQTDFKNPDDHRFLLSAARRFGLWFSRPGNGISHAVHMERFGIPGKTLIGSDSHTTAGGSLGMLAIGAGGLEVALAMAGEPLYFRMPEIWGVKLTGSLPDWVSAKDIILEMLRRYNVKGGVGRIIEYYGPGLKTLSAMDRHVLANMGTELGATTSTFPSDGEIKQYLEKQGRGNQWIELLADEGCEYDVYEEINLSEIEPLIAKPSSPGNVVRVEDVAGKDIYQAYLGSSANPGFRDFAIPAMMVDGRMIHPDISFDINPSTRQVLDNLLEFGHLKTFLRSGGRIHEPGCGGCIGMGQAPATGQRSLRTVPRNFAGRSGTVGDKVYLCSPETATASALKGVITDPRTLDFDYPKFDEPQNLIINTTMLIAPTINGNSIELIKGPNIRSLPSFEPIPQTLEAPVLLKVGDNISTDEILPAGAKILPLRSNIPEISKYVYSRVDKSYYTRAMKIRNDGHIIVGGENYGQGSSREHAAIAPRYLGLKAVIVKSFARIHWQNLINFGILPLTFDNKDDYYTIKEGDVLTIPNIRETITNGSDIRVENKKINETFRVNHVMSDRQIKAILAGSLLSLNHNRS